MAETWTCSRRLESEKHREALELAGSGSGGGEAGGGAAGEVVKGSNDGAGARRALVVACNSDGQGHRRHGVRRQGARHRAARVAGKNRGEGHAGGDKGDAEDGRRSGKAGRRRSGRPWQATARLKADGFVGKSGAIAGETEARLEELAGGKACRSSGEAGEKGDWVRGSSASA